MLPSGPPSPPDFGFDKCLFFGFWNFRKLIQTKISPRYWIMLSSLAPHPLVLLFAFCTWFLLWTRLFENYQKIKTSDLISWKNRGYIDVGDGCWRCWWPIQGVCDRFNHQHNEKTRQHNDYATNIWNQSPSLSHQHNGVINITVTKIDRNTVHRPFSWPFVGNDWLL